MAQSSNDPSGMYLGEKLIQVLMLRYSPPDDDGDLPHLELLHGDLQGVCLPLELHHDGGAHGYLERARPQHPRPLILGHVRRRDPRLGLSTGSVFSRGI